MLRGILLLQVLQPLPSLQILPPKYLSYLFSPSLCPPQAPSALLWPLPESSLDSLPLVFSYVTCPPLVAARMIFLKHKLDPVTLQLNPFGLPVAGNSRPLSHFCT